MDEDELPPVVKMAVEVLIAALKDHKDEVRALAFFELDQVYCEHCGSEKNPVGSRCYCTNDE